MGFCLTFKGVSLNISLEYESARPQNSVAEKGCRNFKRATFDVGLVIFRLSVSHGRCNQRFSAFLHSRLWHGLINEEQKILNKNTVWYLWYFVCRLELCCINHINLNCKLLPLSQVVAQIFCRIRCCSVCCHTRKGVKSCTIIAFHFIRNKYPPLESLRWGPSFLNTIFLTNVCEKKADTHRLCNLVYVLWSRYTCGISLRKAEARRKTNVHWDHRRRLKKKIHRNYYIISE